MKPELKIRIYEVFVTEQTKDFVKFLESSSVENLYLYKIAKITGLSYQTVINKINCLSEAGIVRKIKRGRTHYLEIIE